MTDVKVVAPPQCCPSCACGTHSPATRTIRGLAGLIVLGAAAAILIVKASAALPPSMAAAAVPQAAALPAVAPATDAPLGTWLDGFEALDAVAGQQTLALIYLPDPTVPAVAPSTLAAAREAVEALTANRMAAGLYTMRADSADHPKLVAQVPPPAIVIAQRGTGMTAVTGEITTPKILQAVMALNYSGGCGPAGASGCGPAGASGCGPSGCN